MKKGDFNVKEECKIKQIYQQSNNEQIKNHQKHWWDIILGQLKFQALVIGICDCLIKFFSFKEFLFKNTDGFKSGNLIPKLRIYGTISLFSFKIDICNVFNFITEKDGKNNNKYVKTDANSKSKKAISIMIPTVTSGMIKIFFKNIWINPCSVKTPLVVRAMSPVLLNLLISFGGKWAKIWNIFSRVSWAISAETLFDR